MILSNSSCSRSSCEAPVEEMELEKVTVAEEIKEEESAVEVVEVVEVDEEPETIVEPVVKKSLTQNV